MDERPAAADETPAYRTVVDGCRIAYRLDGPADAPVLALANSLGTDLSIWEPLREELGGSFRLLRYDARGHGASDVPAGAYSLDRLGCDLLELLDALGLGSVHFCGISLGGMIGQWLGFRAPERIEKLVLANTAPYMGPASSWQERIELVGREGMAAIAPALLERWFTPAFHESAPQKVERMRSLLLRASPEGYAGCSAAIRDMDLRPTAALIEPPTLIIAGKHDPSTPPAMVEALARAMTNQPRLVTLDAAHLSNLEQPRAFAQALLDFL